MKNYIIKNATVYKRTEKTATGERVNYWAMCQLTSQDPNDPIPSTPPTLAVLNDDEAKKFWLCSKPIAVGDPRATRYANSRTGVTVEAHEFNFAAGLQAFKDGKFPGSEIPCERKTLVFDENAMDFVEVTKKDPFFLKTNVEAHKRFNLPPGTWAEVATTDRVVTMLDGKTQTIKAGQMVKGKSGETRIVTSFTMAVQYVQEDGEWRPVDDIEQQAQRFIEGHFRRLDQPLPNAPGAPAPSTAEVDVNAEEAARQAEAEKAAAELSGGLSL